MNIPVEGSGGSKARVLCPATPHSAKKKKNHNNIASYKQICSEFGIDSNSDFSYTYEQNHSLGYIHIIYPSGEDYTQKFWIYPPHSFSSPSSQRFADEVGTDDAGNKLDYITNEHGADKQFEHFNPDRANGLTQAGLSRTNQSIEAFFFFFFGILGAQVNVRSSILRDGGRAKEAKNEFLVLVKGEIRMPDLAKSVQRYQLAVDETKVRLNLAVCPCAWLMPPRMIIKSESTIGYKNQLKQATKRMKLGINDDINTNTKALSVAHMDGRPAKVTRFTKLQ